MKIFKWPRGIKCAFITHASCMPPLLSHTHDDACDGALASSHTVNKSFGAYKIEEILKEKGEKAIVFSSSSSFLFFFCPVTFDKCCLKRPFLPPIFYRLLSSATGKRKSVWFTFSISFFLANSHSLGMEWNFWDGQQRRKEFLLA